MLVPASRWHERAGLLAEALGADIEKSRKGIGSDPRIGYHFLTLAAAMVVRAFPKTSKPARTADRHGLPLRAISAVEAANDAQSAGWPTKSSPVLAPTSPAAALPVGLASNPTPTTCAAPSLTLIDALLARGATVAAHEWRARAARVLAGRPGIALPTACRARWTAPTRWRLSPNGRNFAPGLFADLKALACAPRPFLTAAICTTRPACAKPGWNTTRLAAQKVLHASLLETCP